MLQKMTSSPYFCMFSGIVLAASSGYEILHSIGDMTLGSHHGILVFGLMQILKASSELLRGLEEMQESEIREEA